MTTVYDGERAFYLDDTTGRLWDSVNKAVEYDPNTHDELTKRPQAKKDETKEVEVEPDDATAAMVIHELACEHCGFMAKSYPGLQVHKFKKHQTR